MARPVPLWELRRSYPAQPAGTAAGGACCRDAWPTASACRCLYQPLPARRADGRTTGSRLCHRTADRSTPGGVRTGLRCARCSGRTTGSVDLAPGAPGRRGRRTPPGVRGAHRRFLRRGRGAACGGLGGGRHARGHDRRRAALGRGLPAESSWQHEFDLATASITELAVWPSGRVPGGAPRYTVILRVGDVRHLDARVADS